ncbi:hypothetical protein JM18_008448 [Phytophthora kernoviae]|uniref:Major facilitator superfamily (MFS) profile domain-containing protein n=2 Tax=Phytophthora kernoviae TaxID=325452 RepID=A0A921SB93_9STRA|nr:hypothetical protein G195_010217 [Phytophthora kernoviae 00238/432]KAG2513559.1 hypothetical protein JM18_008448 [Phytophthora kernoviae]
MVVVDDVKELKQAVHNEMELIGCGLHQRRVVTILGFGNVADAVEILAIGYILTVYEDTEGAMTPSESSLLTAAVFVGIFGSYGLSTWITKLFKSAGLSNPFANAFLFAGANLPGNIVSLYLIDCIGHQRLLSGALFMSAFCALLFAFNVEGSKTVIVLVSCLFNACTTAAWNGFGVLSAENFPQELRTTGISVVNGSNRVAAITAQFVNGFLMGPPPHLEALLLVTSTVMICGGIASRWIAHGGDDDIDAISKSGSEDLEVESDGSTILARSPEVEVGEQVCVEGSVMAGIFPYSLNLF